MGEEQRMNTVLVKRDENVELTGKTVVLTSGASEKKLGRAAEGKREADPFFEIKSPRATEGDKVTVTVAYC
jgi:thioredoxin reductase